MKRRRDNMMKRYKTKVASLEPTEVTWSKEYTPYQDDVELLRRAAKTLRETYRVEARREEEDRKYRKTLKMEFADPETGLVLFDGNLLAAGREEDGFDSLEDAEREIGKMKRMKVKEEDEDAVALLGLVLEEMEEEDERDKSVVVVALCGSGGEEETSVNAKRLCSSCSEERPALPREYSRGGVSKEA